MKTTTFQDSNLALANTILLELIKIGVEEFIVCPGARMSAFCELLMSFDQLKKYFWYEERSAAFFALGRSRTTAKPTAVIVTSGTAAGELLPAVMEAYYTQTPLILITADRPARFRGSNAPQAGEQVDLFGVYTPVSEDLCKDNCNEFSLKAWDQRFPCQLNVCFEEPMTALRSTDHAVKPRLSHATPNLEQFLHTSNYPFVVVGMLPEHAQKAVKEFLIKLNAPVFLEALSGLREATELAHLRITRTENIWKQAAISNYPIDGILRIGGVPTFRLWRDLEEMPHQMAVCSINEHPFSGLSWGKIYQTNLEQFFSSYEPVSCDSTTSQEWLEADIQFRKNLEQLFDEESQAEASLFYKLSQLISKSSFLFIGNSLPIREWDLAATYRTEHRYVAANRGLNGIDGQLSTFLGMCKPHCENWGIFGDLTTLYDLAGPWIIPQLESLHCNIIVINNGGAQLFSRMFTQPEFLNRHQLTFKGFAELWGLNYEQWRTIPQTFQKQRCLIEIVPDNDASKRFWDKLAQL